MSGNLNRFLSKLANRIAPHAGVRNLIVPEMRSPEVFDSFEPEIRSDLNAFFDARAIAMMDYLAVNEYWFIMMAAATLVRVGALPASTDDVHNGIFLLRGRLRRESERNALFGKLRNGFADRLSGRETDLAKEEGLLVWDVSTPREPLMRLNPVFFQDTGNM